MRARISPCPNVKPGRPTTTATPPSTGRAPAPKPESVSRTDPRTPRHRAGPEGPVRAARAEAAVTVLAARIRPGDDGDDAGDVDGEDDDGEDDDGEVTASGRGSVAPGTDQARRRVAASASARSVSRPWSLT